MFNRTEHRFRSSKGWSPHAAMNRAFSKLKLLDARRLTRVIFTYPIILCEKRKKINKNKNTAERGREWSRVRPIIGLFVDHITTRLHCFSLIADWWDKVNKVKSKDQRGSLGSSWSRLVFYGIVLASGCGNGNFRLQPIHLILFGIASVEKINGRSFFTICQWNNRNAWGL